MVDQVASRTREEIIQKHKEYMFPAVTQLYGEYPIVVDHAKDQYLWDVDGSQYLDFFGGVLTVSVGHCNEEITAQTIEQLQKAQHTSTLYINESMVALAEKLAQITPGRLQKSFFTSTGTEANETAVLAARMYTGNVDIITLRHAYSGRSMLGMTLTAHGNWRLSKVVDPYVKHIRNPYTYRMPDGIDPDKFLDLCVQDLEETLATITSGRIAAFMAEPIQGVGGFIVIPQDYFKRILPIVRAAGGVFICDEVQTGWGRTGHYMCGIEHWGVEPDIMTFAKGLGNGSPIGVTIATPEIADALQGTTFATFGGNPVTMATALATVNYIEKYNLPQNAAEQGARLRAALEDMQREYPFIGDVRGMGLMQGLELVHPDRSPDPARALALINAARQQGLLIGKGGLYGNVIRIAPHLNVTPEDLDAGCEMIRAALASIA